MKITLSWHAKEQARERGITIDQIKRTITSGAKFLQGNKIVADYSYIRVVYRQIRDKYVIITVMIRKCD